MLDEKDLQAIAQIMAQQKTEILETMDTKLERQKDDILQTVDTKLAAQKKELRTDILHDMKVLLDTEVQTKFNLLAEGQEDILRRIPSEEDMEIIDSRLSTLEAMVKKHSREIAALKKAN